MDYDLVVMGSGSGMAVVKGAIDYQDWKVAVIEKGPMGGELVRTGAAFLYSSDVAEEIKRSS